MKRRFALLSVLFAGVAHAGPFDAIDAAYAPYLDKTDPLSFDLKIKSLAADPYKFWRGSKDLFFGWCKTNCADWLTDRDAFVINHGDLHLGNIGTYASEDAWGKLAFGMVDFDDSARLPFAFELLQGFITLDLVASENNLELSSARQAEIDDTLLSSYRVSVNSQRNATDLLADDAGIKKMIEKGQKASYADAVAKSAPDGAFVHVVKKKGAVTELLRPVDGVTLDAFAGAISDAIAADPVVAGRLNFVGVKAVRKALVAAVQRSRVGSSGSQGQRKYLLLMKAPFKGVPGDGILYLKEVIPSSAERSGIVPRDPREPAERLTQDMNHLTEPRPFLNGAVKVAGRTYWLTLKEPWSSELEYDDVKSFDELKHMAAVWGTVAGATHREDGRYDKILPRLTPALKTQLRERAAAYLRLQASQFAEFSNDPRVTAAIGRAEQALN